MRLPATLCAAYPAARLLQNLQHLESASVPWHIQWMERSGNNPLICTFCKEDQMVLILRTRAPAWGKEVLRV